MKKILTLSLAALMAFSAPANVVLAAPDTKVEALSVNVKAAKATAISTVEDLKAMESRELLSCKGYQIVRRFSSVWGQRASI